MTTYELADLSLSSFANMASNYAIFLTAVSAYLAVAYFVGAKLTGTQAVMLTGLFLFASSVSIWAMLSFGVYGVRLVHDAFPDATSGIVSFPRTDTG